jgi:hypothetical protein
VSLKGRHHAGRYVDFKDGAEVELDEAATLSLPAWGWRVLVQ